jgi:Prokaryotic lipoprotein-attachment site
MRIVRARAVRSLAFVVLSAALLLFAACGRKSAPEPPPGADYPRTYPSR